MYSNALRAHFMYIGMNLGILLIGEVMSLAFDPFDGFGGRWADDNATSLRLAVGVLALYTLAQVFLYRSQRMITRRIGLARQRPWVDDPVGRGLEVSWVLSSGSLGGIGVLGLVIFFATGNRFDLYIFVLPTLTLLGVSFPTRARWESDRIRFAGS